MNKFQIVTLFPDYFKNPFQTGLLGRAFKKGLVSASFFNPRQFTDDPSGRVDDYPFGGGDSMILRYQPLKATLERLKQKGCVVYPSPKGKIWTAKRAREFAEQPLITFICGRYGGIDARLIRECVDEEISVGDYILNGGETAVLTLIESLSRFIPGVMGNEISAERESFEGLGLLESPQWTRPREIKGHKIPEVILSGHHGKTEEFRFYVSLVLTALNRPDLLNSALKKDLPVALKYLKALCPEELRALGLKKTDLEKPFDTDSV